MSSLLKLFQLWLLAVLFWLLCSIDITLMSLFCFSEHWLISQDLHCAPCSSCMFPAPVLDSFFQGPLVCFGKWYFRQRPGVYVCPLILGCSWFWIVSDWLSVEIWLYNKPEYLHGLMNISSATLCLFIKLNMSSQKFLQLFFSLFMDNSRIHSLLMCNSPFIIHLLNCMWLSYSVIYLFNIAMCLHFLYSNPEILLILFFSLLFLFLPLWPI